MSNLVCKNCKSVAVEYEDYCGGTSYFHCKTCGMRGSKDKFTPVTVFDRITASPEVLAEKLVYRQASTVFIGEWRSVILPAHLYGCYATKEEAISVTVAKLKEAAE